MSGNLRAECGGLTVIRDEMRVNVEESAGKRNYVTRLEFSRALVSR